MKEPVENRKWPMITPVGNKETIGDISSMSTGSNATRGTCGQWTMSRQAEILNTETGLYRADGTAYTVQKKVTYGLLGQRQRY